ncbi:NAD(P)/FAD-dependent oxidoreductase [Prochlorococcus marinus]|uniref:Aminoacetone oxidase family FAD-binding enzyme n=1 Tax=Prochlorococcus marinus XMU1408 TaxID=2213228 RepID=A0A318R5I9_PROMR|nr:NAD(P)/FAD-dependent oxidoreductase [Prochlorococcus marinus]MBW3041726.1 aminoacetone oxidase family FAD-binding enzyme [Prochlorococcus marinus str. XMU1408]PYE02872.1 aminoacetone oxidase family FAD-binding enzyme [Prochlorococcus marinus XMU1408]
MISDLVIIGGGASGFMGAITAVRNGIGSVVILESTSKVLEKVRISGGGRCNLTNSCWDISNLVNNYPRGEKQLIGLFNRFSTSDAFEWFQEMGLSLKVENDGRIFPCSDSSEDVIKCLKNVARRYGVKVFINSHVKQIRVTSEGFNLLAKGNNYFKAKNILICTGGHPSGRRLAKSLGHTIIHPVPSLFSFSTSDNTLKSCSGITLNVQIKLIVNNKKFTESGTILITHRGFSGPVILRMSAFSARYLYDNKYFGELRINWLCLSEDETRSKIDLFKLENGKKLVLKNKPFNHLPRSLWKALVLSVNIDKQLKWADLSKYEKDTLVKCLTMKNYLINSRGPFGEEFVTAGGVSLNEINFKTMESKICKGLYFAGEVLDIDGITGGFNFQHCWTSGWIAGNAII